MKNATIKGKTEGISKFWQEKLLEIYDIKIPRNEIATMELAQLMGEITSALNREIAVHINRNGVVESVMVGDSSTVAFNESQERFGKNRLGGMRLLHTHPGGNGTLSQMDLSALKLMRLDLVLAFGVGENGNVKNFGLSWGVLGEDMPISYLYNDLRALQYIDFYQEINKIEKDGREDELFETAEKKTKAILVGITGKQSVEETKLSLEELAELAKTADVEVLKIIQQSKSTQDGATFIGKGKVEELRFACQILEADSVIFDDELSPVQIRNLEMLTGKAIIDRSMLILDIFANRARSNEGKLQVELAQLKYMMPRLIGQGEVLSRLGGGIGTRGPGETKLEVDRRLIRKRVSELEGKLKNVEKTRILHRSRRISDGVQQISLVGYTNAGKSTLLNALTDADVLAENMLFATLDTTLRRIELADRREVVLSDTVGFIRKLPHHLIAAFKSTLEEVCESDLLIHVLDASSPEIFEQNKAVLEVLTSLKANEKPVISVLNKIDLIEEETKIQELQDMFPNPVLISAENKIGLTELLGIIEKMLPVLTREIEVLLPYSNGSLLNIIHNNCQVLNEEYTNDGIKIHLSCKDEEYNILEKNNVII